MRVNRTPLVPRRPHRRRSIRPARPRRTDVHQALPLSRPIRPPRSARASPTSPSTTPSTGKPWSLAENTRDAKATVVVFLATGCPVCSAYWPEAGRPAEAVRRGGRRVRRGQQPARPTPPADVAKLAKETKMPFPVLKDDGTKVADKFAVERVPTAFVLDAGADGPVRRPHRRPVRAGRPQAEGDDPRTRRGHRRRPRRPRGEDAFTAAAGCKLTREKKPQPTADRHVPQARRRDRPGEVPGVPPARRGRAVLA